jgi:hypothetical protein
MSSSLDQDNQPYSYTRKHFRRPALHSPTELSPAMTFSAKVDFGLLPFRVKEVLQSRLERTVGVFREAHVESLNDILVRQHMRKCKAQV